MPRLSLWSENKRNDYKYLDRIISEQYTVGGLDMYVHKYLGPKVGGDYSTQSSNYDVTQPVYDESNPLFIEDLFLLENRDRDYDESIYRMRGVYNVQDLDFNLSQFGLFLQNDTLFITFHLTDMIERLGRKIMSGDVLELPHLRDDWPLDDTVPYALRKYYVVQDATRAAEGYSPTWWPHLWRVKATPMVNSQEYQDILDNLTDEETGNPLGDILTNNGRGSLLILKNFLIFRKYYNHIPARIVRKRVSNKIWQNYFKFCIERNPWDKTLSHYYMYRHRAKGKLTIEQYFDINQFCINYPLYTDENQRVLVDSILKYETLNQELSNIFEMLKIPFSGKLNVFAKSEYRKNRKPYQEVLTESQAKEIQDKFQDEIILHRYTY